jgi:hypothetical protein
VPQALPPISFRERGKHFEETASFGKLFEYPDFFQSHGRKIASKYFKDYFVKVIAEGKKREKGTIPNSPSHRSSLA